MKTEENLKAIRNMTIDEGKRTVSIDIDPKIFTLETIFKAAYNFMDKAYILINGDPKSRIVVELTAKDDSELEMMGDDFNNELLSYAVYELQSKRTFELRKMIIARALVGNIPEDELADLEQASADASTSTKGTCSCECEPQVELTEDYKEDPLGIRSAWKEQSPSTAPGTPAEASSKKTEAEEDIPWLSKSTSNFAESSRTPNAKEDKDFTKFEIDGPTVKVKINLNVYPLSSVIFSAEEFRDLCWVSLEKGATSIDVTLKPKDEEMDLKELGSEFLSFLISVYKDETKQEW